ncbi:MAG: DUF1343 domain-containing protein [Verrucomicrobiaceae bacterium]|nr:DUF1343 domain-containing protein [Verrucomicrobiaceae bacterium]
MRVLLVSLLLCLSSEPVVVAGAFSEPKLRELDQSIASYIARGDTPGAVVWMETKGTIHKLVLGDSALVPKRLPMREDAIFDAASLTKVLATAPCIMKLVDDGKLSPDDKVSVHLPEFIGDGRESITVRHLLTHTSGLPPGISKTPAWTGYDEGIRRALSCKPSPAANKLFRYSDVNFILLGEIVKRKGGKPLNECASDWIYKPLGMKSTSFKPDSTLKNRLVPTESDENGQMLHGIVHDPTARRMGGIAGHAGLFTSAEDVAKFVRALLSGGGGILSPKTVALMTSDQITAPIAERRGFGWDIDSNYTRQRGKVFPIGGFGHTGWTGTALWADPGSGTFYVMLSSRLHADGQGEVRSLGEIVGTLVAESAGVTQTPEPPSVLNGVDVVARDGLPRLRGKRVGLITNQTGIAMDRKATIDVLQACPGVNLVALFSPEHGIRGALDQEKINDEHDKRTGLPIFSLYGERRHPSDKQLAQLDAFVFDIQDIGTRFYTYIATMKACMNAAAKAGKMFVVLDRVNPLGGLTVEGPTNPEKLDFTACHNIPIRHGMTAGELAKMFVAEEKWTLNLDVVRCEGWRRQDWFDATGLPWQNPSPNMRSLTAATLYPGIGLLEFVISVGRGTNTPFEILGAPYVNDRKLAWELNRLALPGVRFIAERFTPSTSLFSGESCGGVRVLITERGEFEPLKTGLAIGCVLRRLYGSKFDLTKFNRLMSDDAAIESIRTTSLWEETERRWDEDSKVFLERRKPFLLY